MVFGYSDSFNDDTLHDFLVLKLDWVIRMNSSGDILWQYRYGGSGNDYAESVQVTPDGGYIIAGRTVSFGQGNSDVWLLKLSDSGDIEWQKTYGSSGNDHPYSIQVTSDGGYIVVVYTQSYGAGDYDIWVMKLNDRGECTPLDSDTFVIPQIPTPASNVPADVVITANLGSYNTNCTINEDPDVTVTPLVP